MKKCANCKIDKELSEFSKGNNVLDGLDYQCKSCKKQYGKLHRSMNVSKRKETQLKSRYNLKLEDVEKMYVLQEGKCKICGDFKSTFSTLGGLYVDHCHSTGKVRGLLCASCNTLLGSAKDKISILCKAIEYLEISRQKESLPITEG